MHLVGTFASPHSLFLNPKKNNGLGWSKLDIRSHYRTLEERGGFERSDWPGRR